MAGDTTRRGYGNAHQKLRKRWARLLAREGQLPCTRCDRPVLVSEEWELDHTDDRTSYAGVAHKLCNRRAGGLKAQATRIIVRQW